MSEFRERFTYLFHRYYGQMASPEEKAELMQLLDGSADDEELVRLAREAWENQDADQPLFTEQQSRDMLGKILGREAPVGNIYSVTPVRRIPTRRSTWLRYAAAVLLLVLLGVARNYLIHHKDLRPAVAASKIATQDIAPGGSKAVLTLGNGSTIILDSIQNGTLATQGNAEVIKTHSGQLAYRAGSEKATDAVYNTLTTPRGGQFQLGLPDGTKVWLNAASSITYPTAFTGNERKVTITGEAYFEVAHSAKQPFIVKAGNQSIEDLGTHFNINAYVDEPSASTTLLEGSIEVGKQVLSHSGQQIRVSRDGVTTLLNKVDIAEVIAWKMGLFEFNDADIKTVMRALSRWYGVDVQYETGDDGALFTGQIRRDSKASEALHILSLSGYHFKIKGTTILVE